MKRSIEKIRSWRKELFLILFEDFLQIPPAMCAGWMMWKRTRLYEIVPENFNPDTQSTPMPRFPVYSE